MAFGAIYFMGEFCDDVEFCDLEIELIEREMETRDPSAKYETVAQDDANSYVSPLHSPLF